MQNFAKSNFVKTVLRGNRGMQGMKCFWQRGIQKVFCNVTTHCKMKIASWRSKDFGYSDTTPNLCYLQCLSGCLGTKTLIILLVLLIEIFYFMKTLEPMSQSINSYRAAKINFESFQSLKSAKNSYLATATKPSIQA